MKSDKVREEQGGEPITMKQAADAVKRMSMNLWVDRFLSWPLPDSLRSDDCVTQPGYPNRIGTNLMTADQARQMLAHVLHDET